MASASTVGARRKGAASGRKQVAVGYLRRSTDRQEQSIPDQQKSIEGYAEEHGFRILRFVVRHNEGQCQVTMRKIPTIAGESLAAATEERTVRFGAATGCSPRKR